MGSRIAISAERGVKVPSLAYEEMHKAVLGAKHELSLAFVTRATAKKINKASRKKTYTPNVLSFPLSKTSGEIVICPAVAREQAGDYGLSPDQFVGKLFIHGLFHLKGLRHGSRMESEERRIERRFKIS